MQHESAGHGHLNLKIQMLTFSAINLPSGSKCPIGEIEPYIFYLYVHEISREFLATIRTKSTPQGKHSFQKFVVSSIKKKKPETCST